MKNIVIQLRIVMGIALLVFGILCVAGRQWTGWSCLLLSGANGIAVLRTLYSKKTTAT